jgi:hypothetical protein
MKITPMACIIVGDVICRFIHPNTNTILAQAGPVFGRRRKMPLPRKRIANFLWSEPNATAAAADRIWGIYLMTAPNQPANAIASTVSAWFLSLPKA